MYVILAVYLLLAYVLGLLVLQEVLQFELFSLEVGVLGVQLADE